MPRQGRSPSTGTSSDRSAVIDRDGQFVVVKGLERGDDVRRRAVLLLAMCGLTPDITDEEAEEEAHARLEARELSRVLLTDDDMTLAELRRELARRRAHGGAQTDVLDDIERRIRHLELMDKWTTIPVSSEW